MSHGAIATGLDGRGRWARKRPHNRGRLDAAGQLPQYVVLRHLGLEWDWQRTWTRDSKLMDRKWFAVIVAAALPAIALVGWPSLVGAQGYDTQLDKSGIDTRLDKGGINSSVDQSGIDNSADDKGIDTSFDKSGIDKTVDDSGIDNPAKVPKAPTSSGPKIIHAPKGNSN